MASTGIFAYVYEVTLENNGRYSMVSINKVISPTATGVAVAEVPDGTDSTAELSTSTTDKFTYTLSGGSQSQQFTYSGAAGIHNGTDVSAGSFIAQGADNKYYLFTDKNLANAPNNQSLTVNSRTDTTIKVICFLPGTQIATPHAEVSVETLQRGDLVQTADGRVVPVRWVGRQTISTVFADPLRVLPICIKAGALAENVPSRDLYVSPDHAILIDDILVHASALVNGTSIVRAPAPAQTFTYYHVELADHSLLLADNVPAESFIDNVDRLAFDNWDEHEALDETAPLVEMAYPRAKAARQVPSAIRERLAARGQALVGRVTSAAA
jgi:hypothetical protein